MSKMRIEDNIKKANNRGDVAIGFYTVLGYPNLPISKETLLLLHKYNVTLFETALPVSDPSPELSNTIRNALINMDMNQISIIDVLQTYSAFRPNLYIIHKGTSFTSFEVLLEEMEGYVDGILIGWDDEKCYRTAQKYDIEVAQTITPFMNKEEIKHRSQLAEGLIYLEVSMQTGGKLYHLSVIEKTIELIKSVRNRPICCGFGIKTPEDVRRIASLKECNGILVGTQLLKVMEKGIGPIEEYIQNVVAACKGIKKLE